MESSHINKAFEREDSGEGGSELSDEDEDEFAKYYQVIQDFIAEEEDDLTISKGEILEFVDEGDNGWWIMINQNKEEGQVPSNFLKEFTELEEHSIATGQIKEKMLSGTGKNVSKWAKIRKDIAQSQTVDISDVLSAFGAFNIGFRSPTLGKLLKESDAYSTRAFIVPKLSPSGISFDDLQWEKSSGKIRSHATKTLGNISIVSCKNIPPLPSGVEVISRNIHVTLYDGTRILSNIISIPVNTTQHANQWTVPNKDKINNVLVRSSSTSSILGVLFEFSVVYIRNPPKKIVHYSDGSVAKYSETDDEEMERKLREKLRKDGARSEISCGWSFFKLLDDNGINKPDNSYEIEIKGGKPFEENINLNPINNKSPRSKLRSLIAQNKQAILVLKLNSLVGTGIMYLNQLPKNIILNANYCELVSYFRYNMAKALLRNKTRKSKLGIISSPDLSIFADSISNHKAMDAMVNYWTVKTKKLTKIQKFDDVIMTKLFHEMVTGVGYLTLTEPEMDHSSAEESTKHNFVQEFLGGQTSNLNKVVNGGKQQLLEQLLSPQKDYTPFDADELNFDIVKECCNTRF